VPRCAVPARDLDTMTIQATTEGGAGRSIDGRALHRQLWADQFVGRERELERIAIGLQAASDGQATTSFCRDGRHRPEPAPRETRRRNRFSGEPFASSTAVRCRPSVSRTHRSLRTRATADSASRRHTRGAGRFPRAMPWPDCAEREVAAGRTGVAARPSAKSPLRSGARLGCTSRAGASGAARWTAARRPVHGGPAQATRDTRPGQHSWLAWRAVSGVTVIATYQPDASTVHPCEARSRRLRLRSRSRASRAALERAELGQLIEAIEGTRPSSTTLLLVAERSGGNPLIARSCWPPAAS